MPVPTYDPGTPAGQVRLLIPDTHVDPPENAVFTDVEITGFLTLEGGSVRRAAAQALDTIASNEAMVSKVIRTQDLSTDGTKVAAELRARAATLREQAAAGDDDATGESAFSVIDFDATPDYWLAGM